MSEIQFPSYQKPNPNGPDHADRKSQGPLIKMIGKMLPKGLKPKIPRGPHALRQLDQSVHIKHGKVKFY